MLSGSPSLREKVRDLVSQVEASRKELVVQASSGGFSMDTMRGAQFEQVMRLRTLNRFSARLPSLVLLPNITPFTMYLELRELLGELVALHPDRDEFDCGAYDHENPNLCFSELITKIRSYLRGTVKDSFLKVAFNRDGNGKLAASLSEEHLNQPNAYFLGIRTKLDPTSLARYVQDGDRFKLMPLSLTDRAIRGIELKEERIVPTVLPAQADLHYFRMDRAGSSRMWEQIKAEKAAGIRWIGSELDWSDATFTLYMTVPMNTKT